MIRALLFPLAVAGFFVALMVGLFIGDRAWLSIYDE